MCPHLLAVAVALATSSLLAPVNGSYVGSSPSTCGKAVGVHRDAHGHIKRSQQAKSEFKKSHPCPSTGKSSGACEGYVIDHVIPLKRGGADAPDNMQWQTVPEAKAKDHWE